MSIARPIVDILGNPLLIENAFNKGAIKDPIWAKASIEPAPID